MQTCRWTDLRRVREGRTSLDRRLLKYEVLWLDQYGDQSCLSEVVTSEWSDHRSDILFDQ